MTRTGLDEAWEILIERKADRKENRVAFIAALFMARCKIALPNGEGFETIPANMAAAFSVEFARLAGRIKTLAEQDCNVGLNDRQQAESDKLQARFAALAKALGFEARTGGDPRGACAVLIDPADRNGDGWGEGYAVYS